ncbi:ABC transporter permease [Calidifontibacter sp. DB0510]|uniref:ABC transporter permease n=1 Tax=Metallococcus carri TaxID=1656884 RepID=A0A967AYM0_9MICO|nr:ABC transporter permease [Metallococcus carri]NHN55088.1 ABC transporter permease [Metallococcus carri]NOP36165.1 ABC transporter permease [Calidifontibacter sp. DB2511S]
MLRYIARRVLQMIGVMFALSLLIFAWLRALPGGPVDALLGERATPERRAALRKVLGLDQPLPVQYLKFLDNAAHGNFGVSSAVQPGTDAMQVFLTRLPATMELTGVAIVLALATGIPLGYLAAKRHGGIFDNLGVLLSLVGVAVPVFFLAFVLKQYFAVDWQLLPLNGRQNPDLNATRVTGFFILDGILTREFDASWDAFLHLILPGVALATIPFAVVFRITRASVLDVLDEDFVRTAEAKGLTRQVIRRRHVLRNALLPVVTTIGLQVGGLLTGAVLTETVFSIAGLGDAMNLAFQQKDFSVLQVLIVMAATTYVVVNLLVDIAYAYIDPRVRTR